jgi:hypothetical protein
VPIVAIILIFDPLCHAVMYLIKPVGGVPTRTAEVADD